MGIKGGTGSIKGGTGGTGGSEVSCGVGGASRDSPGFVAMECLQTVVLEKTPESPLDSKEIKLVNPKGNQS